MTRMSFTREPAAWVALAAAIIDAAVAAGAPIDSGLKAAIIAVVTALAGILIRSQVRPAATSADVAFAPTVHVSGSDATWRDEAEYRDGKLRRRSRVTIRSTSAPKVEGRPQRRKPPTSKNV